MLATDYKNEGCMGEKYSTLRVVPCGDYTVSLKVVHPDNTEVENIDSRDVELRREQAISLRNQLNKFIGIATGAKVCAYAHNAVEIVGDNTLLIRPNTDVDDRDYPMSLTFNGEETVYNHADLDAIIGVLQQIKAEAKAPTVEQPPRTYRA